jgi:hypothetical protein
MGATLPNQEILLTSFSKKNIHDKVTIEEISILGSDENIEWSMNKKGLKVKAPSKVIDRMATVIKVRISA